MNCGQRLLWQAAKGPSTPVEVVGSTKSWPAGRRREYFTTLQGITHTRPTNNVRLCSGKHGHQRGFDELLDGVLLCSMCVYVLPTTQQHTRCLRAHGRSPICEKINKDMLHRMFIWVHETSPEVWILPLVTTPILHGHVLLIIARLWIIISQYT
jgi:hypothetical protein